MLPQFDRVALARILLLVVVLAVVAVGAQELRVRGVQAELADARTEIERERLAVSRERLANQTALLAEKTRAAREAQRINDEAQARTAASAARAAHAERTAAGLRDTITRLNARPVPADPVAAGHAREASEARELLGACTAEYRSLAAEADQLRDQVTGLIEWTEQVATQGGSR